MRVAIGWERVVNSGISAVRAAIGLPRPVREYRIRRAHEIDAVAKKHYPRTRPELRR